MQILMSKGSAGEDVDRLRQALARVLGADAAPFPSLQAAGTPIDEGFDAAIRRWQAGVGLIADGVVGPRCQQLLDLVAIDTAQFELTLNVSNVSRLFPATKPANIARYLPYIEAALGVAQLTDRAMILGALGTIRAETEGFVPIAEAPSKFNTPPGGPPFSLYDKRTALGNSQAGDGERYRGRGFVQLTGKDNYTRYGERIGVPLAAAPDRANAPEVAAVLLALYLADKAAKFRQAIRGGDLAQARKLVNGGAHGLDRFKDVFDRAATVWPPARAGAARRGAAAAAAAAEPTPTERAAVSRTRKDTADLRDRVFLPSAISLPDEFPPTEEVRQYLPAYTRAGLILDQGREGACTGFGLSCVINYLRWVKSGLPAQLESVSPRMLYTLARRHDEYEGENYEGSSCRGALKGWFNHGVCLEQDWPYLPEKSNPATYGFAARASQNTLGVYYRVDISSITDLQAAIAQHRAVFVSAFTHAGWDAVPMAPAPKSHPDLPLIAFDGRRSQTGGHAFALIGFNAQGFILQNSWGKGWGAGGFAVLGYLDWLANAMDAWVVALGVPGVVAGRLAVGGAGASAALSGTDRSKWWDTGLAYQHSVVLGNDGRVSRYLTEDEQPRKLQQQACVLPDTWFRQQQTATQRLVLYVHGGLNSEEEAIKRASAMGRYFIGNGCYPLFLVWKTGLFETIGNLIADAFRADARAGAGIGEWVTEKTDLLVEKSVGRPLARPLWSEMKENAELAFAVRRGGDLLLDALQALAANWGEKFELHLVGHSAGSIAIGHLLGALAERQRTRRDGGLGGRIASVSLYAPACSVAFANRHYAGDAALMARLHLDVLSDAVERADTVGPIYRKSLLYLVSNALEADLHTPILGLDRINDPAYSGWDGSSDTGEALALWRQAAEASKLETRTQRVQGPRIEVALDAGGQPVLERPAHGAFDNDIEVMTRTLERITGAKLAMPVEDLRGF
ncbi:C1 family peptidase [Variovorax sp. JS1663]|uniref:C1 family peptidase n=1 Tax=Variovorax sp. JS1663 TaxID=1851577 RepID=UPI000B348D5B|nr:C1 family peptidase [Variovorax sp. JS1663]OUM02637.1 peptidase C1 [Variovorax sp. JS1663]